MNPLCPLEQIEILKFVGLLFTKYGKDETLLIEIALVTSLDGNSSLI